LSAFDGACRKIEQVRCRATAEEFDQDAAALLNRVEHIAERPAGALGMGPKALLLLVVRERIYEACGLRPGRSFAVGNTGQTGNRLDQNVAIEPMTPLNGSIFS
jgi:hypothetical protein